MLHQSLQNSQTLGQFFEQLYYLILDKSTKIGKENSGGWQLSTKAVVDTFGITLSSLSISAAGWRIQTACALALSRCQ